MQLKLFTRTLHIPLFGSFCVVVPKLDNLGIVNIGKHVLPHYVTGIKQRDVSKVTAGVGDKGPCNGSEVLHEPGVSVHYAK